MIDRIRYALHRLTCPLCRAGSRLVVVSGRELHIAPDPQARRIPWERIVTR